MVDSTTEQIKGMITYPCCPQKKAVVKYNAHGCATHPCLAVGNILNLTMIVWKQRLLSHFVAHHTDIRIIGNH